MKTILNLISLLLILVFTSHPLLSQSNTSCLQATPVCSDDTLYETAFFNSIEDGEMVNIPLCGDLIDVFMGQWIETMAIWYRYEFISEGDFVFSIIPDSPGDDFDFVLFRSTSGDCDMENSVRCMFSGENVDAPGDEACMGATGLSYESIDLYESGGCQWGDDNFLAPVQVVAGDVLYLAVLGWDTNDPIRFTLTHGGTAEIDCSSNLIKSTKYLSSFLYPNPVRSSIHFQSPDNVSFQTWEIISVTGKPILKGCFEENPHYKIIGLEFLPDGLYLLRLTDPNGNFTLKSFIK